MSAPKPPELRRILREACVTSREVGEALSVSARLVRYWCSLDESKAVQIPEPQWRKLREFMQKSPEIET